MKLHRIAAIAALSLASIAAADETSIGGHAQLPPGITLDDISAANAARRASPVRVPAKSFDDVQYWIGTGANRAAFVLDFNDGMTNDAFVWGYRWDGTTATGADMLLAIVDADPFLHGFFSAPGPFGISTFGFGFDEDHDAGAYSFGGQISPPANGPWVDTDADVVTNGPLDPDDHFEAAWFSGNYWGLMLSTNEGAAWTDASTGVSGHTLVDDEWLGLTFGGFPSTAPANWTAAAEPSSSVGNWTAYE